MLIYELLSLKDLPTFQKRQRNLYRHQLHVAFKTFSACIAADSQMKSKVLRCQ